MTDLDAVEVRAATEAMAESGGRSWPEVKESLGLGDTDIDAVVGRDEARDALLAALRAAREDGARLDWMERFVHDINDFAILSDDEDGVWINGGQRWLEPFGVPRGLLRTRSQYLLSGEQHCNTLRAAIDAARAGEATT